MRKQRMATPNVFFKNGRQKGPPAEIEEKPKDNKPATRKCLNCFQPFKSEGWGNRICPQCKEWPDRYLGKVLNMCEPRKKRHRFRRRVD